MLAWAAQHPYLPSCGTALAARRPRRTARKNQLASLDMTIVHACDAAATRLTLDASYWSNPLNRPQGSDIGIDRNNVRQDPDPIRHAANAGGLPGRDHDFSRVGSLSSRHLQRVRSASGTSGSAHHARQIQNPPNPRSAGIVSQNRPGVCSTFCLRPVSRGSFFTRSPIPARATRSS